MSGKTVAKPRAKQQENVAQERTYLVQDAGDRSVGIWPLEEEVTVSFKHGGHSADTFDALDADMVPLLKNLFDATSVEPLPNFARRVTGVPVGDNGHIMSNAPISRCVYCGADEDDVFIGGSVCPGPKGRKP